MTKKKSGSRLDDSDITKFEKDGPPPKDVSPERLTELRKKLEANLRTQVELTAKTPRAKQAKKPQPPSRK